MGPFRLTLEAVTVCVGYGDFLRETARVNRPLVDDLVVVTSPDDDETRAVCRQHSIHYILSEEHRRGGPFNKARLIQRALDQIGGHGWILHVDADIVLPQKFRQYLDWAHLDERCIYGADRCNLVGWDRWRSLKQHVGTWDNHAHECGHWFHPELQTGSRWVSKHHGYVPIGFFQLFHGSAIVNNGYHQRHYPLHHGDAARTDVQFALQWDRRFRQLLPEVIVLHLESEKAKVGANWAGRKTRPFGPSAEVASCQLPVASKKPDERHDDRRHHHHYF
jgi:Glycosyltransferase like family 2